MITLYQIKLPYATFGIEVRAGLVIRAGVRLANFSILGYELHLIKSDIGE